MGYPDVIYPEEALEKLVGACIKGLKYRPDSYTICQRHSIAYRPVPDAESLFELYGASLDVYDITDERGCEIICDLNYPFPANACGQYDYVLDVGTLEHCFNVAQALVNMACLLKVGGIVIHENPFNWGNHGFYNLNPTLFHDFYTDNGFALLECVLLPRKGDCIVEISPTGRFRYTGDEANVFTIAQRIEEKEMNFPVQHKYRRKDK